MVRLGLVAATLIVIPQLSAAAPKLWERDWLEVETDHFVIASALPERRTVQLAIELENFRRAVQLVGHIPVSDERIPTKVYVVPTATHDLGLGVARFGYLVPAMRANYAVITSAGNQSSAILKHEYVHFLLRNHNAQVYPTWFDEGFAEVLSTLRVDEGFVEYGEPLGIRKRTLDADGWMPYPSLLQVRDTDVLGPAAPKYYAQSWLLMHYLTIGRRAEFAAEAADFLERAERGEPAAFEAAFGIDPRRLARTLRAYEGNLAYYRTMLGEPFPAVDYRVRRKAPDEVAADLGSLALLRGDTAVAKKYYGRALARNPTNGAALAGMGDVRRFAGRYDDAAQLYERAMALEPDNASHELGLGELLLARAVRENDRSARRALLVEARRHFARSYRIDPENPETLDRNGLTYLFAGEDAVRAVESLETAYEQLPSQWTIQFDLARAYLRTGELDRARLLLRRLLTWGHTGAVQQVRKVLAVVDEVEAASPVSTVSTVSTAEAAGP